ncbi:MAG: Transporter, partial [Frankiales bacterium]|nr:Transporter [Frankiales bacterium]
MSRRTARHARPSRAATAVVPAAVGGALLLGPTAAFADGLLPGLPPLPLPQPTSSPAASPAPAPSASPAPSPVASPSPSASPTTTRAGADAAGTRELLRLVNARRTSLGLPAVALDRRLAAQALTHTRDMVAAGRLSHADSLFTRATKARLGLRLVGENVAYAGDVARAHRQLLDSPHHREIVQTRGWDVVGLAVVRDDDGAVWVTEDFGTLRAVAPSAVQHASPASTPAPAGSVRAPGSAGVAASRPAAAASVVPAPRPVHLVPVSRAADRELARHLGPVPSGPVLAARLRTAFRDAPLAHAVPARRV